MVEKKLVCLRRNYHSEAVMVFRTVATQSNFGAYWKMAQANMSTFHCKAPVLASLHIHNLLLIFDNCLSKFYQFFV